jgi:hypothetical protein
MTEIRITRARVLTALGAFLVAGPMACGLPIGATTSTSSTGRSSGGSGGGGGGAGTVGAPVQVLVTDDPFPYPFFSAIALRVSKVEVKDSSGNYTTLEDWGASFGTFEILGLTNGKSLSMATKSLPAVSFTAIRITMPGIHCYALNGQTFTVAAENGGVLELPVSFSGGGRSSVVFDFDAAQSITVLATKAAAGGPITSAAEIAGLQFSPTGRAALVGSGGNVQGTVTNPDGSPAVGADVRCLDGGGNELACAQSDGSGSFAVVELPSGSYSLTAESAGQPMGTVNGVLVNAGATVSVPIALGTTTGSTAQPLPGPPPPMVPPPPPMVPPPPPMVPPPPPPLLPPLLPLPGQ